MYNANVQNELRSILWDIKYDPQGSIDNGITAIGYALHYLGNGNMVPTRILDIGSYSSVHNDEFYAESDEYENARIFSDMVYDARATAEDLQYYLLILDRMYHTIPEDRRY